MAHTSFTITIDVALEQDEANSISNTLRNVASEYLNFAGTHVPKEITSANVIVPPSKTYTCRFDDCPQDPRFDDYPFIFFAAHKRYSLGHEGAVDPRTLNEKDILLSLPVYIYDHGGITINTTGFSCRYDSRQVGIIYMTKESFEKSGWEEFDNDEAAFDAMRAFIKDVDHIIQNDCWYINSTNEEGESNDDDVSFIGDIDYADFPEADRDLVELAWENRFE